MKKKLLKLCFIVFYLVSIFLFLFYVTWEISPNFTLDVFGKLLSLGLGCLTFYFGSFFLGFVVSRKLKATLMRVTVWIFFLSYLVLLVTFVLFDSTFGRTIKNIFLIDKEAISFYLKHSLNLVPFRTIVECVVGFFHHTKSIGFVITNLLGNLIAFMPFALFLPILFIKINRFKRFLITMILIVTGVELLQFITLSGACDVDDIILNVSGAIILYKVVTTKLVKGLIRRILFIE